MLWNLFLFLLVAFFVAVFILILVEDQKSKKNPIPLAINHDKRFDKITNRYSHKIFDIDKGEL